MSVTRLATIPWDHVAAELVAYPLASEASLELAASEIDPKMGGPTRALWENAEREVLGRFPGFSIDEAVALRDRIWFRDACSRNGDRVSLGEFLKVLSRASLESRGSYAIPIVPGGEQSPDQRGRGAAARRTWRWLSLALPEDLLLAGLADGSRIPTRVETVAPALERSLRERGYAETHLHVGAALRFPLLWVAVQVAAARSDMAERAFQSPGAGLDVGRRLAAWLVRALLARRFLAVYLSCFSSYRDFREFVQRNLEPQVGDCLGATAVASVRHILGELLSGTLHPDQMPFSICRSLYAELSGASTTVLPDDPEEILQADPIAPLLESEGVGGASPELRFMVKSLRYLEEREDTLFRDLFWQVVRIRCLLYRHVTQRPLTAGLQWFVRFYGRGRPARSVLSPMQLVLSAAQVDGAGAGLRSLEIRTSPSGTVSEILDLVKQVGDASRCLDERMSNPDEHPSEPRQRRIEVGLVFHFIKERGGGAREGAPIAHWRQSCADPVANPAERVSNPSGYRYARYYNARRNEAITLAWLLTHFPLCLEIVRGVDVCTDELGVPNWVLTPLIAYVQRAGEGAAAEALKTFGCSLPPLRTTVHAGEDYVHLLTGLRNLDNAITYFGLNEGDRIGHALSLGVDARQWARRSSGLPMICEDRLLDLVWEWSSSVGQRTASGIDRTASVEHEIAALSERVFGEPISPYRLTLLVQDLHDPERLRAVGFPNGFGYDAHHESGHDELCSRERLLFEYLTDRGVFERGREIVWVECGPEAEALALLQANLRNKVGALGLVVEVNPTSNLLIGDISDLSSHPMWRMNPPRGEGDAPPVALCIGSDDPVVFASDLRGEYQLVCDSLALAGLSEDEIARWCERTRVCGLDHRFTLNERTGLNIARSPASTNQVPLPVP